MIKRIFFISFLLGSVISACAPKRKIIRISSEIDINAVNVDKSYEDLKKKYSNSKKINFAPDSNLVELSLRKAKENINFEVPARKVIFSATVWDLPLIKAYLKDQNINLNTSVGEELYAQLMVDHQKYTQFLLQVDSYVDEYFRFADWTIWLEDKTGKSYFPPKTKETLNEEVVLELDNEILGKRTQRPGYKIFHHFGTLYFNRLDLPPLSPIKLVLLDKDQTRKLEFSFQIEGISPLFPERYVSPLETVEPKRVPVEIINPLEAKRLHFGQATTFYKNGEYREAIREWEKVLAIDPGHKLSKIKIEKARVNLGDMEEAQEIYSEKQKNHQMQIYFLMGSEQYKAGNYEEAIEAWEEVLKLDPNHELSKYKIKKAEELLNND